LVAFHLILTRKTHKTVGAPKKNVEYKCAAENKVTVLLLAAFALVGKHQHEFLNLWEECFNMAEVRSVFFYNEF